MTGKSITHNTGFMHSMNKFSLLYTYQSIETSHGLVFVICTHTCSSIAGFHLENCPGGGGGGGGGNWRNLDFKGGGHDGQRSAKVSQTPSGGLGYA